MPTPCWQTVDSVLLDMDGTLLDLHFDNRFWLQHVPLRYAQRHGLSAAEAQARLQLLFTQHAGTLDWYCLDFWSAKLDLPILQLKHELAELIVPLPDALAFLQALDARGLRPLLVTNAHPASLALKLERVALAPWFQGLVSTHQIGYPKEDARLWQALEAQWGFEPQRTLFIDDSLPVLRAARAHGIAQLLAVRHPDSRQGPRDTAEFPALESYAELLASLPG